MANFRQVTIFAYNLTIVSKSESMFAGFMIPQGTVRHGSRCSTSKAFLRPVRHRPNLHISKNSHVLKIIIDPDTKTATGVQFEKQGKIYVVDATKEVILSAGAIASPQILMLSGVGPADHLIEKGITPILDQPYVGKNLQDHVGIIGMVFLIGKLQYIYLILCAIID
jgi:glucose dehydrogenase (acceptor)